MFAIVLLLLGIVWLYFWLKGHWFAAVIGAPILGAGFILYHGVFDPMGRVGQPTDILWLFGCMACTLFPIGIRECIRQEQQKDLAHKKLQIALRHPTNARFNG